VSEALPRWASEAVTCGHCGCHFRPTLRQAKSTKYEGRTVYCSPVCRKAARPRKVLPTHGPCPTCGEMFVSRYLKTFCSLRCYNLSPQFKEMAAANNSIVQKGSAHPSYKREIRKCLECGAEFEVIPSRKNKFCSHLHYREYMAKRFDRWIASPQHIALPQNFDEFMTQEELSCLVDGCEWRGRHLSVHVQLAHGILAKDFKRAVGFNLGTGLVNPDLHQRLVAQNAGSSVRGDLVLARENSPWVEGYVVNYQSLEGKEHRHKARLIVASACGPDRICPGCGMEFQQSTPMGKAKYCSPACRDKHYAITRRKRGDREP
jgi:hypothetical protein